MNQYEQRLKKILDRNRIGVFVKAGTQSKLECAYCLLLFNSLEYLNNHIKIFHPIDLESIETDKIKNPYLILKKPYCPIGCNHEITSQ